MRTRFVAPLLVCTTLTLTPAAPAMAAAAEKAPPKLRLEDNARPTRYAARITVDPAQPTFHGAIDIALQVARATDLVWLNGTDLTVGKAAFTVNGSTIGARVVPGGEDFIGFAVDKPLPVGPATLHIEYEGPLSRKEDRGLFAQKEGSRWYAITQFEAIFARRVFPCFDEPGSKVPWQLTLEVPKALAVVSNTAATSEKSEHAGMKTVAFAPTPPLPSYLVAFAVGPYDIVDAGKAGKKQTALRVFAPSGRARDARYAASVSGKLLELLEGYFGIPFPFDKLDNVTIPITSTFGAMENAGMVTYGLNYIIAKPSNQSLDFEREYAATAAHEFAHQWFGDLVTTAWWNDIWLNESFASWMESKILDQYKPEWTHHTSFVEARASALHSDTLMTARQVRQPIVSNDDIYNMFDAITYEKGESVLAMFERFVGPEKFRAGIQGYLHKHANGNATADDFIASIAQAAGRPEVTAAFKTFLDQPGAPLVDVALACTPGKPARLVVKQQRFLPVGSKGSPNQTWQIPMCVRWSGEHDAAAQGTCALVSHQKDEIQLGAAAGCPSWVLANDGELGYYRAAYAPELLRKLLGADGRTKLDLPETVGVLDDLHALVGAGRMPLGDALALMPSLAGDPRRNVQESVIEMVAELRHHLVGPAQRPGYTRFIAKLFGARAHALGWTPKPGEDDDTRMLRPALVGLVADEGEDAQLRREARTLAEKWLKDRNAVSPDVASSLLFAAARGGDRAFFDKVKAAARRAGDRHDRQLLLATLGSFRDPALAKEALALIGSDDFDPRESTRILRGLDRDEETRTLAWDYVRAHFDDMLKRMSAEMMAYMPHVAISFCDDAHEREMTDFFKDRSPKLPGGPRLLAQAQEEIALCRAYVAAQKPSVTSFLERY